MFAIYFDVREDALQLKSGFFAGLSDIFPDITQDVFPKAKCYNNMLRAEKTAKLIMSRQPSISGYQIKEISMDMLCPTFECTAYRTGDCLNYEGCIGCSTYGNCNFCSKENCVKNCAYHKNFSKEHGRHRILSREIVLH